MNEETESIDQEEQRKHAAPPTLDEVRSFFGENGITATDPDRFWCYYDSLGWRTARGNPISDWKKKAAQWAAEDKRHGHPFGSGGPDAARRAQDGGSAPSEKRAPSVEEVMARHHVNRDEALQLISRNLA